MKLREARKKIFGQGGDLAIHGGDRKFFGWGGTGLDGGGQPLHGVWSPPIPPMLGTPDSIELQPMKDDCCCCFLHLL